MRTTSLALITLLTGHLVAGQQAGPRAKTDSERIQGKWLIVTLEAGGKGEPERNYLGNTLSFTKDKAILRESPFPEVEFTCTLDPTKTPKTIDLTARNATVHGIYKLDGDDLTMCLSIGGMRPTEFATRAGSDTELFILKRNRWEPYTDKAFGYSVELPAKPEERKRRAVTPAGELPTTLQVVRHDGESVWYLVSVTPLPGKLDLTAYAAALDAVQDLLLAEVDVRAKATVENDRPFSLGKGPLNGKELTIGLESPKSKVKGVARVRLFIAGDRVYGLMAIGPDDAIKPSEVAQFWNSFNRNATKKKG